MSKLTTFLFIPLFKHFKGTEENKHRHQKMTGERCTGLQGARGCREWSTGSMQKLTEMKPMADTAEDTVSIPIPAARETNL